MAASGQTDDVVRALRSHLTGEVVGAGDEAYDTARSVWNGMIDKRPVAVASVPRPPTTWRRRSAWRARPACRSPCAAAATTSPGWRRRGRRGDRPVADEAVTVDPERRRATRPGRRDLAGGGRRDAALRPRGAGRPGLGDRGGRPDARRRHRLAAAQARPEPATIWSAAELVTADGRVVRASLDENPDLLWALRGGGGNFGVVTSFEFQLHPVGPEVAYALVDLRRRGDRGRPCAPSARSAPACRASSRRSPSPAALPTAWKACPPSADGKPMLAVAAAYVGPPDDGEEALRPLRGLGDGRSPTSAAACPTRSSSSSSTRSTRAAGTTTGSRRPWPSSATRDRRRRRVRGDAAVAAQHHRRVADGRRPRARSRPAAPPTPAAPPAIS